MEEQNQNTPHPQQQNSDNFNGPSFSERTLNKLRTSATLRLFIIGVLILVLLIPSGMIQSLILERQATHNDAVNEISDKWGREQRITGPILAIPFQETRISNGQTYNVKTWAYYLPGDLEITGKLESEKKHRGIYEAVVYNSKLQFKGNFESTMLQAIPALPTSAIMSEARLLVGVTDVRGIRNKVQLSWDSVAVNAEPGVDGELLTSGLSFPLANIDFGKGGSFKFELDMAGSQAMYFAPVGKNNSVKLSSNWGNPSYDGAFLPVSHTETANSSVAEWKVLELNRSFVQHWNGGTNQSLTSSDFGVKLWMADEYQKSYRSVRYCVLFIALTFIFYFIIELKSGVNVHPVQYLLIGMAISIFYLLLLSLSEYTGFNTAYFISAVAVTSLIGLFSIAVLNNKLYALMAGAIQVLLYVFLYTTLQLQDISLLIGSIGLFITLALLMYFSRGLNKIAQSA